MQKKSKAEMERAKITKTTRSIIRLKHSLEADLEINDILPDTLAEFDEALSHGDFKKLKSNLADVLG